jgi:IS5 family transposase
MLGAGMARRRIGQEQLAVCGVEPRGGRSLDEVAALVDRVELERLLGGISASAKGEPDWPPLAPLRGLLLAMWHDLSDVRLAEALDDRASFRRFCGFAAYERTPERTAFVRFRAELVPADWTGPYSRRSRVSLMPVVSWCARARWSTPP